MEEEELIRETMSILGSRTSARKKQSSADNLKKAREARVITDAMREKMALAQKARRERERKEELSNGQ